MIYLLPFCSDCSLRKVLSDHMGHFKALTCIKWRESAHFRVLLSKMACTYGKVMAKRACRICPLFNCILQVYTLLRRLQEIVHRYSESVLRPTMHYRYFGDRKSASVPDWRRTTWKYQLLIHFLASPAGRKCFPKIWTTQIVMFVSRLCVTCGNVNGSEPPELSTYRCLFIKCKCSELNVVFHHQSA